MGLQALPLPLQINNMDFSQALSVSEIAAQIGAEIIGDPRQMVSGINEIHHVRPGDITFVDVAKYFEKALNSAATVVILNEKVAAPAGKTLLLCENPYQAYNSLILAQRPRTYLGAQIDPSAQIDPTAIIEHGAVIGPNVSIGPRSLIQANVVVSEHTIIGADVCVQAGALIGSEAFYYKRTAKGFDKWRSGGRVVLEDGVDIGPGCTIAKGVSSDTVIGAGSVLDAQVHIGHDVKIGERCLFAAQVGIGGNCQVGDEVIMYGQVGVAQNLKIGDRVVILAKSGVSKDLEAGKTYFGYPAQEARTAYRELAALRSLRGR
jgi:UDP-3-O-[3-hydroxymyristoyl] glucosamine N-acyltransferase